MWELMRLGIEMQERMIEVHAKGLKLTQDMLRETERKAAVPGTMQDAAREANRIQEEIVDHWFDLWSWRI